MVESALVTGGTKGLGRALSLGLARRGHAVLALHRSDVAAAADLEREAIAAGLSIETRQHDVTSGAPIPLPEGDPLVVIHNAAAAFAPTPLHLIGWDAFQAGLEVAVRGGFDVARAALPRMIRAKRGTFVLVSSSALLGSPPKGFAHYAAAKAALRSLGESIAVEYGPRGVRVLSVAPGFMDTELTRAWDPRVRDAMVASSGPVPDVADVAARILDLTFDESLPARGELHPIDLLTR